MSDVLAAHLGAVDEVVGRAVAAHGAAQGDLVVGRVLSPDLAVGIIEHQFDRRGAQGLARGRAVENDVRHGLAAQMLGRNFAHHPAHRVDDVGLSASIRTHDPGQAARKGYGGRVDKGFEAGNLEFR